MDIPKPPALQATEAKERPATDTSAGEATLTSHIRLMRGCELESAQLPRVLARLTVAARPVFPVSAGAGTTESVLWPLLGCAGTGPGLNQESAIGEQRRDEAERHAV